MKAIVLVAICVGSLPAAATEVPIGWKLIPISETLVHTDSGLWFPRRWNGMTRISVRTFDTDGRNVSVGYKTEENGRTLTLYLYPPDLDGLPNPEAHFKAAVGAVLQHHPEAEVGEAGSMMLPLGGSSSPGYIAFLHWAEDSGEVGSFLVIIPKAKRFLKVRVSFEMDEDPLAIKRARDCLFAFLRSIKLKS